MPIHKVLIVDDSRTELLYLGEILRSASYVVDTAQNADDALAKLESNRPDLVLMDVVMPGSKKNGFQLTRTITRDVRYAGLPIILCTSKGQVTDRAWGMRQGARDYIVKPVQKEELLTKVKALD